MPIRELVFNTSEFILYSIWAVYTILYSASYANPWAVVTFLTSRLCPWPALGGRTKAVLPMPAGAPLPPHTLNLTPAQALLPHLHTLTDTCCPHRGCWQWLCENNPRQEGCVLPQEHLGHSPAECSGTCRVPTALQGITFRHLLIYLLGQGLPPGGVQSRGTGAQNGS